MLESSRVEDLVVIVPFVTNILMSAADSVVFRPPNPWTMALVDVLALIYDTNLPSVKLALKFEIVVLFILSKHKKKAGLCRFTPDFNRNSM